MVGKAPEILESSRSSSSVENGSRVEVLSTETASSGIVRPTRRRLPNRQPKQNFKKVLPKEEAKLVINHQDPCFVTGTPTCLTLPRVPSQTDILASAFNSAFSPDDCITIIVPTQDESDCVILEEAVQEVTTSSYLVPPFKDEPLSPRSDISAVKSDCGYESFGSPHSDVSSSEAMSDLWNESFTQLFPNTLI